MFIDTSLSVFFKKQSPAFIVKLQFNETRRKRILTSRDEACFGVHTRDYKTNPTSKIRNLQSLRVLTIEDSENDALLIIRGLKKDGYNPVYEGMETAAAMKKAP